MFRYPMDNPSYSYRDRARKLLEMKIENHPSQEERFSQKIPDEIHEQDIGL